MSVSPGRGLSRRTSCCPGLRTHPAPRSNTCNLLPDPACPEHAREHCSPTQPSEGQKTILLLCQALGKLPPPPCILFSASYPAWEFQEHLHASLAQPHICMSVPAARAALPSHRHGAGPTVPTHACSRHPPVPRQPFLLARGGKSSEPFRASRRLPREPKCFVPGQSPWVNK